MRKVGWRSGVVCIGNQYTDDPVIAESEVLLQQANREKNTQNLTMSSLYLIRLDQAQLLLMRLSIWIEEHDRLLRSESG